MTPWRTTWPRGLVGRIAVVLVAALLLELVGITLLNAWQDRSLVSAERSRAIAQRLVVAQRMATREPIDDRSHLLAELAVDGMTVNWVPHTVITDGTETHTRLAEMKATLIALAPDLAARDLRLSLIPSDIAGRRDLLGVVGLPDGSFVSFRVRPFLNSPPAFMLVAGLHILLTAFVIGLALVLVRSLVGPLSRLAAAADATGHGVVATFPIEGPWEVRHVATAFGAMQERLLRMIDDQTRALLSVSHDLRTPAQRLRLRAAMLDDEEARDAMAADLKDIEMFLGSVMAYLDTGTTEAPRLIDIAALAMTIVDNLADTGAGIDYDGVDMLPARVRPLALKRALGNLTDNAVRHAVQVRVGVTIEDGRPVISVEDNGPGIAEADRAAALMPFRRLTLGGGAGLGLAIVKSAVESMGGTLTLDRSEMGGLAARIGLPVTAMATQDRLA